MSTMLYMPNVMPPAVTPSLASTRSSALRSSALPIAAPPTAAPPLAALPAVPYIPLAARFGSRLRELRKSHQLTQTELAVFLGIDRSFISELENGKTSVSLLFIDVIAQGFNLPISELMSGL